MLDANFWQNKSNSQKVIKEKKLYEDLINSYKSSIQNLQDLDELNQLALEEGNINIQNEVLNNIKNLREIVKKMKLDVFYQMKPIFLIVILKFMQERAGLKAKTGQKCLDECI